MNNKVSDVGKCMVVRSRKESSEKSSKHSLQTPVKLAPRESPQKLTVGVALSIVKSDSAGRKRASTMVSTSPTGCMPIEEKKRPSSFGGSQNNWSNVLREQNQMKMKQSIQHYALRSQPAKSSKHSSDAKDVKKTSGPIKQQKYDGYQGGKLLDEIPVKQVPTQKKSSDKVKAASSSNVPSTTSSTSCEETYEVVERGIQCNGVFDQTNDRFKAFNPVKLLEFLMIELQGLVKDNESGRVLSEMEQALKRIPSDVGRQSEIDSEVIALHKKLDICTAELEATSKKANATCKALTEKNEALQLQLQRQNNLNEEAKHREMKLETSVMTLKEQLYDANKINTDKEKIVEELSTNIEILRNLSGDLRKELNEQTELAQQRFMDLQFATIEKEKLLVVSSYKDEIITELRTAMKRLQDYISEQLAGLQQAHKSKDFALRPDMSLIQRGKACSSPTPTSSDRSLVPLSWQEGSEISLSTVERFSPVGVFRNGNAVTKKSDDTNKNKGESCTNNSVTLLEFVSLPAGESSYPIQKDGNYKERGESVSNQNESPEKDANRAITESLVENNELNDKDTQEGLSITNLYIAAKKDESDKKRRHSREKRHRKDMHSENGEKHSKNHSTNPLIDNNIKEVQNIFDDMRLQTRFPVRIPSPPRKYPNPDWSDSSLPSMSGVSEWNAG